MKDIKKLAKELDKKIKKEGWSISVHTYILSLIWTINNIKE